MTKFEAWKFESKKLDCCESVSVPCESRMPFLATRASSAFELRHSQLDYPGGTLPS